MYIKVLYSVNINHLQGDLCKGDRLQSNKVIIAKVINIKVKLYKGKGE